MPHRTMLQKLCSKQIYNHSLSCLGTGTSIESSGYNVIKLKFYLSLDKMETKNKNKSITSIYLIYVTDVELLLRTTSPNL